MKHRSLILLFAILPQILKAQTGQLFKNAISIDYNDVYVGRNFNVTYHTAVSKGISLYGGVKLHLNKVDRGEGDDHSVFRKKSFAETGSQHWGAKAGFEVSLFRTSHSELFAFYDFQYTHATLRQSNYWVVGYDTSDEAPVYKYETRIFGPVHTFENNIGVGARFSLSKRLFVKGFVGGGSMLIKYNPVDEIHKVTFVGSSLNHEFCRMFGFGLEYKLK